MHSEAYCTLQFTESNFRCDQVMKNSYENGGIKAPDTGALNKALKVKQYMNATKSKNKINLLQKLFTSEAAPNSMVQMVYKAN